MRRLALIVLSSPTLVGSALSLLVAISPARAAEIVTHGTNTLQCQPNPQTSRLTCVRISQPSAATASTVAIPIQVAQVNVTDSAVPNAPQVAESDPSPSNPAVLEFSEEESDAAVALFGCDCQLCLNAIRQMRGLPPIS